MPCLHVPGTLLARCGTLRPPSSQSSSMRTSPNTATASEGHCSSGRADGAPTGTNEDTASSAQTMPQGQADRPALSSSLTDDTATATATATSTCNASSNSSKSSTRCASPIPHHRHQAAAVTDILAISPSRITRPQIELVEASLPLLDNLVPPMSTTTAATATSADADICPPMIHNWMSKCADGALGRDPSAERMCLQVRRTFGACSHHVLGGGSL